MGRKSFTHEQFMEKFMEKNSNAKNIEVLGTYKNAHTKIKCKCKIDGYEWEVKPYSLLQGKSCLKCSGKMQKTHEEFVKELEKINSDIEVLGTYVNNHTKIKVKCKIDGNIWEAIPSDLLNNHGCSICSGTKKKTHEEFIKEIEKINNDIEVLSTYVNNCTKIKCKCKIDGYIWEVRPYSLLRGNGCPQCGGTMQKTHEEFVKELEKMNSDIEIVGTYKTNKTKIKCKCKKDGYIWEVTPNSLLQGNGCPRCSGRHKTHEEFVKELEEMNSDIEILDTYVNSRTKIKCKCKIDGHEWEATPSSLLRGYGCPKCNQSKGEKRISKYLDSIDLKYETQYTFEDCKCKNVLPFDSYIPSLNIAIEYDGEDHYMIFIRSKNETYEKAMNRFIDRKIKDTIKTWYCKQNNINLIRIPYWNFDNIEEILEKELEKVLTLNK